MICESLRERNHFLFPKLIYLGNLLARDLLHHKPRVRSTAQGATFGNTDNRISVRAKDPFLLAFTSLMSPFDIYKKFLRFMLLIGCTKYFYIFNLIMLRNLV